MSGFVQVAENSVGSGSTSINVTLTGVAAGNTILVAAYSGFSASDTSLACNDNVNAGAYARDGLTGITLDGDTIAVFSKPNQGGGSTIVTVSRSSTSGSFRMVAAEYNGLLTSAIFDQIGLGYNASSSSGTTTPLTTTQANELLFGLIGTAGNDTFTSGSSFNKRGGTITALGIQDQVVSSIGAYSANFTISATDEYAAILVSYKMSGGGGGSVFNPYFYRQVAGQ